MLLLLLEFSFSQVTILLLESKTLVPSTPGPSTSATVRLLFLMADSIAVMRSTTGISSGEMASPLSPFKTLFSSWMRSLLKYFLPIYLTVCQCDVSMLVIDCFAVLVLFSKRKVHFVFVIPCSFFVL